MILSRAALARIAPFALFMALLALWIHLDAPWMRVGEPSAIFVPIG
jgi:hypothetical protein